MSRKHTDLKEALEKVVQAWEVLHEGYFTPNEIQKWLVSDMAPAIKEARLALMWGDSKIVKWPKL